jgi:transcriptional regulator with XRE-family HTH domain
MKGESKQVTSLGEKIRLLRTEKGLSPGRLAKLSGVSRPYLWQLESGGKKHHPSFDVLEKLAHALGVTVADFSVAETKLSDKGDIPVGLAEFYRKRGRSLGVRRTDVEIMKSVSFRGRQPTDPDDWELLYMFLRKWVR